MASSQILQAIDRRKKKNKPAPSKEKLRERERDTKSAGPELLAEH
jgi:hypothetical protein